MKRLLKKLPLLLFVLGLGSALAYGFRPQPVPVDVVPVKRGAMQVTVDEDGKTRLKQVYVVSAPLPGNLRRAEVVERYAAASGCNVSDILFYYVYGLFKVAVIAQQIYYRYKQGLTKDERFAAMIGAVRTLGRTAGLALDKGRIDQLRT